MLSGSLIMCSSFFWCYVPVGTKHDFQLQCSYEYFHSYLLRAFLPIDRYVCLYRLESAKILYALEGRGKILDRRDLNIWIAARVPLRLLGSLDHHSGILVMTTMKITQSRSIVRAIKSVEGEMRWCRCCAVQINRKEATLESKCRQTDQMIGLRVITKVNYGYCAW